MLRHMFVVVLLIVAILVGFIPQMASVQAQTDCPNEPSQLSVGQQAQVTARKDIYATPSSNAEEIGRVYSGDIVTIIGTYQCGYYGMSRVRWQNIQTQDGTVGWVIEIQEGKDYRLIPYSGSSASGSQQPSQPIPTQAPNVVTDGCSDHLDQTYAGESSPPEGDYLRVNASGLRVRMGPGTNYCINGYAVEGRYYPVHNVKGSWALITGTYGAGWLHTDYVTLYINGDEPEIPFDPDSYFDLVSPYDQWDFETQIQMIRAMLDINWQSAVDVLNDLWDCGLTASGLLAAFGEAYTAASSASHPLVWAALATAGFGHGLWEYVEPDTAAECAVAVWDRVSSDQTNH
jgi:hypothetical protein